VKDKKTRALISSIMILGCGIAWSSTQSCILPNDSYAFNQSINDFTQTDSIVPNKFVETAIERVKKDLARGAEVYPEEIRAIYVCLNKDCHLDSMYIVVYVDDASCPLKEVSGNKYRFQVVEVRIHPDENKVSATSLVRAVTQQLPKWDHISVKVDKALEITLDKTQGVYIDEPFRVIEVLMLDSWYVSLYSENLSSTESTKLQINYMDGSINTTRVVIGTNDG
jgi:hypothetical protein